MFKENSFQETRGRFITCFRGGSILSLPLLLSYSAPWLGRSKSPKKRNLEREIVALLTARQNVFEEQSRENEASAGGAVVGKREVAAVLEGLVPVQAEVGS